MKPTFFLAGCLAASLLAVSRAQTLDTDTLDTFLDRLASKQKGCLLYTSDAADE